MSFTFKHFKYQQFKNIMIADLVYSFLRGKVNTCCCLWNIYSVSANNFPRSTLSSVQLGDLKLQTCSFQLIDNDKTYGKHLCSRDFVLCYLTETLIEETHYQGNLLSPAGARAILLILKNDALDIMKIPRYPVCVWSLWGLILNAWNCFLWNPRSMPRENI